MQQRFCSCYTTARLVFFAVYSCLSTLNCHLFPLSIQADQISKLQSFFSWLSDASSKLKSSFCLICPLSGCTSHFVGLSCTGSIIISSWKKKKKKQIKEDFARALSACLNERFCFDSLSSFICCAGQDYNSHFSVKYFSPFDGFDSFLN